MKEWNGGSGLGALISRVNVMVQVLTNMNTDQRLPSLYIYVLGKVGNHR